MGEGENQVGAGLLTDCLSRIYELNQNVIYVEGCRRYQNPTTLGFQHPHQTHKKSNRIEPHQIKHSKSVVAPLVIYRIAHQVDICTRFILCNIFFKLRYTRNTFDLLYLRICTLFLSVLLFPSIFSFPVSPCLNS